MNHHHCGTDYSALPGNFQRIDACLARSMSFAEAKNLLLTNTADPLNLMDGLVLNPGSMALLLDGSGLIFAPNAWTVPEQGKVICERLPAGEAVILLWAELRLVSADAYVTAGFSEYPNEKMFDALKKVSEYHAVALATSTELVDGVLVYTYSWEPYRHGKEDTQGSH